MEEEQGREEKEELRQPSLGGDKGGRTLEFAQMSAMSRKYSASQLSSPPKAIHRNIASHWMGSDCTVRLWSC